MRQVELVYDTALHSVMQQRVCTINITHAMDIFHLLVKEKSMAWGL